MPPQATRLCILKCYELSDSNFPSDVRRGGRDVSQKNKWVVWNLMILSLLCRVKKLIKEWDNKGLVSSVCVFNTWEVHLCFSLCLLCQWTTPSWINSCKCCQRYQSMSQSTLCPFLTVPMVPAGHWCLISSVYLKDAGSQATIRVWCHCRNPLHFSRKIPTALCGFSLKQLLNYCASTSFCQIVQCVMIKTTN